MAAEKKQGKKDKKGCVRISTVRHVVQVLMLVLFCLPVVACGWGLLGIGIPPTDSMSAPGSAPAELVFFGTLSSSSIGGVVLLDPFATLQMVAASKTVSLAWLLGVLPVVAVYGLIRGRAFCGWVCPVNLILEIADWIRARLRLRVYERVIPRHAKLWVALAVLVLSALVGFPVFEALSPVSFINKGIVLGSVVGGITLIAILLMELFWGHRVWCRALCPLGGFYEVLGKLGLANIKINHEACIGCDKCKRACLCDPEILDDPTSGKSDGVCAGDCMLCGKCVDVCPTSALSVGVGRPKKIEE